MGPIEPVIPSPPAETVPDTTDNTTAPRGAADQSPLRAEDVHVRPPDHLPEDVTPEAENVELIFERS